MTADISGVRADVMEGWLQGLKDGSCEGCIVSINYSTANMDQGLYAPIIMISFIYYFEITNVLYYILLQDIIIQNIFSYV